MNLAKNLADYVSAGISNLFRVNIWNRMFFHHFKYYGLSFNDVLVKPNHGKILPYQADISAYLTNHIKLKIPFVSSDMDSVTDAIMAKSLAKLGGLGFLYKTNDIATQVGWVAEVKYAVNGMISKPITVSPDQTYKEVKERLERFGKRFSTLVVVDKDNAVLGLVTKETFPEKNLEAKVKDFMIKENPTTFKKEFDEEGKPLTIKKAYDLMKAHNIGKVVVTDNEGKLAGLYCKSDVTDIVDGKTPTYNRDSEGRLRVGANVGVIDFTSGNPDDSDVLERTEALLKEGCDVILVGAAHGDSKNVIETVKAINSKFRRSYKFGLVAGNVVTYRGAKALFKAGADAVKVGLGPGSICTTREMSGCGSGQLKAIYNVARAGRRYNKPVIADGGIQYSGDVVKALVAGADCVMMGNLFAATDQSAARVVIDPDTGEVFKVYRGMGSLEAMRENKSSKSRYGVIETQKAVPEGVCGVLKPSGPVGTFINNFVGGLRSGMGYMGAKTVRKMSKRGKFEFITDQGLRESRVHDIIMTTQPADYSVNK